MKESRHFRQSAVAWHPNFRVVETLPDTKVIRTSFLVNSVAVVVLMAAIAVFTQRELALADVRTESDDWQRTIDQNKPKLVRDLQLQKEFSEEEKRVREVTKFLGGNFKITEILVRLGSTLPRMIVIDSIDFHAENLTLRGTLVGSSDRTTGLANSYIEQLIRDPVIGAKFEGIRLSDIRRDQQTNRLVFEIQMNLKSAKPRNP
jgi:hypothetical protein